MTDTGKQRSQRIEMDYYRRRDGLSRWRFYCILTGFTLTAVYLVYALVAGNAASQFSTGPLSATHAHFEQQCNSCHADLARLDSQASRINLPKFGLTVNDAVGNIESKCSSCHGVGTHHRKMLTDAYQQIDQNCAACHVEHQGRDQSLTAVADQRCVECHGNLSQTCTGKVDSRNEITAFTLVAHPEFRSLTAGDPGRILFDHAQHMLPGQVKSGNRGGTRHERISPPDRSRYQADASGLVQLQCADCHQFAGTLRDPNQAVANVDQGPLMEPISFEKHCQACHGIFAGTNPADAAPLPHGQPWRSIEVLIAASIEGSRATNQARRPGNDQQSTPQVGEGTGVDRSIPRAEVSVEEIEFGRSLVQTQCQKCHDAKDLTDGAIAASVSELAAPLIPEMWLRHGLYDHWAHRDIDCRHCHAQAYGISDAADTADNDKKNDRDIVMIAGIESCIVCHRGDENPAQNQLTLFGSMPDHASDRCTLCHRYHPAQYEGGVPVRFRNHEKVE